MTHRWSPLNGRKPTIVYCQPVNTGTVYRCIFPEICLAHLGEI